MQLRIWNLPLVVLPWLALSVAKAADIRFNAFGDVSVGMPLGDPASEDDAAEYAANGVDEYPVNTYRGFQITGTDFVVTADLDEDLTFQGEVNLQVCRGCSSDFEVDVERMYLNYKLHPLANVQVGLYFTPIGYQNRNLYARAWLMNSVQIHDFTEEELGLVPTHTTGAMLHGTWAGSSTAVMYALSVGNGRPTDPDGAIYARDTNPATEVAALVEFRLMNFKNFRIGLSGWTDRIETGINGPAYGDAAVGTDMVKLKDTGFNPFIVFDNGTFGFSAEAVSSKMVDVNPDGMKLTDNGWQSSSFAFSSFTSELVVHLNDGKLHPYVRMDKTELPAENGGPFFTQREGSHKYVPDFNAVMVGVAYDIYTFNRLKLEYISHQDGPRRNSVVMQSAFAF
jgi:hypothetical protein